MSSTERLLDAAGHRRSPVTMPGYHQGRPPKNKGLRFPADPRPSRRSSPSCAPPATTQTAPACER
jgi:hypothetical protein